MDSFSLEHCAQISAPALPIFHATGTLDLRLADCMDVMREFPDKHFDLAIVDPPYGMGEIADSEKSAGVKNGNKHVSKGWNDAPPPPEYFAELCRVSRNQIVWGGNYFPLPVSRGWIFWDKHAPIVNYADGELAWTSFDKNLRKFSMHWLGGIRAQMEKGYVNIHPTQKPVKLYSWLLANYAKQGQRILDTHLGSGSHAIACHYFGAHLTACEIDADYYTAACARIARETAQMTLAHQ
jgi:site-specific DNA-methyltransferase (adenine-specific)